MKTLQKIEKNKEIWLLLFAIFLFFILRLPSLIEPLWYGDEGIYQIIGMALNHDRLLYSQIWDNKPPLLYIFYALANSDQFTIRLLSFIFGALSIMPFYYLAIRIFRVFRISGIITSIYAFLIATPFIEGNIANAENFMLLPIIAAAFLIYKTQEMKQKKYIQISKNLILNTKYLMLFCAGILLGIALLLKTVALFDFAAFIVFISLLESNSGIILKKLAVYISGFLVPILITFVYLSNFGILADFIQAVFLSNIDYIGFADKYPVPYGLLAIKLLVLFTSVILIFRKRKIIPQAVLFILLWFIFSLFNVLFSGRVWPHYLLIIVPSTALMLGLLFERQARRQKFIILGLLLILIYISIAYFKLKLTNVTDIREYYQNFLSFITNEKTVTEYEEYFDKRVTRDYEIAHFLRNKIKPSDAIFIWGNSPQIYTLSNSLPAGKYTAAYHISENPKAIEETAETLKKIKPKYIIILPETPNFPFSIGMYLNKFKIKGVDIYERIY